MYYGVNAYADASGRYIKSARSLDGGLSWDEDPGQRVEGPGVSQPACTKLANGHYRLYWIGGTTASRNSVFSALSSNGLAFTNEAARRVSVTARVIDDISLFRMPDGVHWRMLYAAGESDQSLFDVYSVRTTSPLITGVSPSTLQNDAAAVLTITGEVFDVGATVRLVKDGIELVPVSVDRTHDMELTATFDLVNQNPGAWTVKVINSDGLYTTYASPFSLVMPSGDLFLVDNLIRSWENKPAQIRFAIYGNGQVTLKIYTLDGRLVQTLADESFTAGTHTRTWDGRNSDGALVGSGVYVVHITGPALNTRKRMVMVR
jgi:hypothetical protein